MIMLLLFFNTLTGICSITFHKFRDLERFFYNRNINSFLNFGVKMILAFYGEHLYTFKNLWVRVGDLAFLLKKIV